MSYYLGHRHEQKLTQLASRITLKAQKEVSMYFFDTVTIEENGHKHCLKGISISGTGLTPEEIKKMIKDLDCIFWNEQDNAYPSELLLIVAPDKETVQLWYDNQREGSISTKICKKFNYFNDLVDQDEVDKFREELKVNTPRILVED